MRKIKLSLKLLLGALFTGAIVVYSFVQPFQEGAVCSAFPAQASFVFKADSLAELLQSPVCSQLDKALGAGNSLAELAASNDWKKWAAASEIAVADIPFRNAGAQKTWVAASWVGWRSPWLRWKLEAATGGNLEFLGKHSVWPIWEYTSPDLANGMSLTFALTDNLLIACLSESPSDMIPLLDAYDNRIPSYSTGK
ncbi:hypothetical protein P4B35_12895 [Pontiellaceae bacterium B12227]|nr:hypothetical protein [Pontiellaceae bacterium B12227]